MQAVLPHVLEQSRRRHRQRRGMSLTRHGSSVTMAAKARCLDRCRARVCRPHSLSLDLARAGSHRVSGGGEYVYELMERFKNDVPMKRFAEPEEIGELVLFVCSDACEYMTADTVYVKRRRLALSVFILH